MPTEPTPPVPAARPIGLTRQASLAIGAAVVLGVTIFSAGNFSVDVIVQGAADGVLLIAWLLAGYGIGETLLSRVTRFGIPRRVFTAWNTKPCHPDHGDDKNLHRVTAVALGLGVMSLLTLGFGLAGIYSVATTWGVIGVGLALLGWRWRTHSLRDVRPWLSQRSPGANVAWLLAVPLAVAFVAASMSPGFLWKPLDPHPYDVLSYHLQIPREWYDAGRILPLRHNSFSFFPMGMEMHFLTAMNLAGGPWKGMYLCQFMSLAHGVLTVLGVIAVCRANGVGPVVSRLAGLMTASVPWVLMLSSVAYVESGVMLYTLLAVAWAMRALTSVTSGSDVVKTEKKRNELSNSQRHAAAPAADFPDDANRFDSFNVPQNRQLTLQRGGLISTAIIAMTIAGACAGFACGMKYTAVAMTALPLLIVWPIIALSRGVFSRDAASRRLGFRLIVGPTLAATVACGVVFSPWLVRNAAWSGNPVFPLATGVFGPGHFTADQVDRYRIAHSPTEKDRPLTARPRVLVERVIADPQFGYLLVPLTLLAGWACVRSRAVGFLGLMLLATLAVWLLATHLLPRFLSPAIPLAAVLIAIGFGTVSRIKSPFRQAHFSGPVFREHSEPCPVVDRPAAVGSPGADERISWRRAIQWIGGAAMLAQAAVGVGWTWSTLAATLPLGREGLFRLADLSIIETEETHAARTSGDKVAIVGDAQAFFYVVPSDRLLYRGVFDVVVPPGTDVADAWDGQSIDALRRAGYWVVINTSELDRLTKTYAHLPRPTPPWNTVAPTPVVLPPIR